ncbi:DUF2783 domain-containing protein [Polaromonas sp. SM01]|uniref:DUF2783 domain-containing protein n=1 Tax=Polaromonas sp. SM01 TaxID=3085630 RepID=UPI0029825F84|nr:DUF2783 domain-containing protein [Polaromonas sp. SM01]MDW5441904.1 DUF2783 domain-containing protein [Polaromonas sp. SM01]
MSDQEFDDVYTRLCYALTDAGEAQTPSVLARLTLLLMKQVDDATLIHQAIGAALLEENTP